ncbi:MAG TPA: radical SAM protein [Deferrisomatales bacterium]|nr:radical SAM protein [Deferrisomatales bacterium]
MADPARAVENRTFAVSLADGWAVEAVFYPTGTLCLSTQVGCAVGCPFCASGGRGLHRNLTVGELWLQVDAARDRGWQPGRITLSGIGEPLHNAAVTEAFLLQARGRGIPVSVTTTGHPLDRLRRLLTLPHNGVMLSLHAGTSATHAWLVPRGPEFEALWDTLGGLWPDLSRARRRKVGINLLLLAGVNDGPEEIEALADRLATHPEATVHLLTPNPAPGSPFRAPEAARVQDIWAGLRARGVHARRANPWRQLRRGGCGTLVAGPSGTTAAGPA